MMHVIRCTTLAALVLAGAAVPGNAQTSAGAWTDWGGGYVRGPDSASTTVATSGAGSAKPAPTIVPQAPANVPMTDWGGGYLRGPDSASTTVATSGAGTPKPNN
ncbi:hypothetical protein FHS31_002169 [Sphingomonas vulcanisoli]|uniref:Uncharacterized protein n=1 Tax=Sphingomonas vulcanisoli TaxID=1658060 RepID=A0ABX0TSR0_9SPHN|nr:hypothetical protein [Sphingomonas vulcanisoli]NIJ08548.1 hypothetical protein [Sphingomonas vulcanisoli]